MSGEQLGERRKSRSDNRSRPIGDQGDDRAALGNFVRSIAYSLSVKPNTRVLETEAIGAWRRPAATDSQRSEEHTSELQSPCNLVCRLLLEKKKKKHVRCALSVQR